MGLSPTQVAMQDSIDVYDEMQFQDRFPADKKPAPAAPAAGTSLISTVSSGDGETGGGNGFMNWWGKDSTQEKFQGLMGTLGALGAGLAGLPAGGTDMSSLERGAAGMVAAPEKARRQIEMRRFTKYVKGQMETETDPQRKMMLQYALANPEQAGQILMREGPDAIEARLVRMKELEHELGMERVEAEIQGRKDVAGIKQGPSPALMNSIMSANAWFQRLSPEDQNKIKGGGFSQGMVDPSMTALIPFLYSPHGGILFGMGAEPSFDFNVDESVTVDGESWVDQIGGFITSNDEREEQIGEVLHDPDSYVAKFWEYYLLKDGQKGSDAATETVGSRMFPKK